MVWILLKYKKDKKKSLQISQENRKLGSPVNLHVKLLPTEAGGLKVLLIIICTILFVQNSYWLQVQ